MERDQLLNEEILVRLCQLSNLRLLESEQGELLHDLQTIKRFVDNIHGVDTREVEPLSHPLDMDQVLREDSTVDEIDRATYQELARDIGDGYLVPRVIEP